MNLKGGSGKTTTAQHISIAKASLGKKVLFVDIDKQMTGYKFFERNQSQFPNGYDGVIDYAFSNTDDLLDLLQKHKDSYDYVYIDTPPYLADTLVFVANIADLIIITCQPRFKDIEATEEIVSVLKAHKILNVQVLITRKKHNSPDDKARAKIALLGYPILTTSIREYNAYDDADEQGKGIIHLEDKKAYNAASDIHNLTTELTRLI